MSHVLALFLSVLLHGKSQWQTPTQPHRPGHHQGQCHKRPQWHYPTQIYRTSHRHHGCWTNGTCQHRGPSW